MLPGGRVPDPDGVDDDSGYESDDDSDSSSDTPTQDVDNPPGTPRSRAGATGDTGGNWDGGDDDGASSDGSSGGGSSGSSGGGGSSPDPSTPQGPTGGSDGSGWSGGSDDDDSGDGIEEGDNPAGPGGPAPFPGTGSDTGDSPNGDDEGDSNLPDGPPQGPRGPQGEGNVGSGETDGPEIGDDVVPGGDDEEGGSTGGKIKPDNPISKVSDDITVQKGDTASDLASKFEAQTGLQAGEDFTVTRQDGEFVTEYTTSYYDQQYAREYDERFPDLDIGPNDINVEQTTNDSGQSVVSASLTEGARKQTIVEQVDDQFERFYIDEDDVTFEKTTGENGSTQFVPSLTEETEQTISERDIADAADVQVTEISITDSGTVKPQSEDAARGLAEYQVNQQSPSADDIQVTEVSDGVYRATATGTEGNVQPTGDLDNLTATIGTSEGIQALEDAREAQRRAAETRQAFLRGNYGNPNEIQEEQVADQVSDKFGFEVTAGDISVSESDGSDDLNVEFSDSTKRAATLTKGADFLRRDVGIERTDSGDFDVNLPGDNPAIEEALSQRVTQGEAFGGETKISALGHTLNVEELTEGIASWAESNSAEAVDLLDDVNAFHPTRSAFVGEDSDSQSLLEADSPGEATEDLTLQAVEKTGVTLGNLPKDILEMGETATDPLAYEGVLDADEELAVQPSEVSAADIKNAADTAADLGEGAIETAQRADTAARNNPEAATGVVTSLLGATGAAVATSGLASVGISSVAARSTKAARGLELALDPVRTTARGAASVSRAIPTPDVSGRTRRTLQEATPEVSVVEDPNSGTLDVNMDEVRSVRTDVTNAVKETATPDIELGTLDDLDTTPGDVLASARDRTTDATLRIQDSTPDVSNDIALQQTFTRGSSFPTGNRRGSDLAERIGDAATDVRTRFSDAQTTAALRSPSVSGDIALQQAFTRGSDLPSLDIDFSGAARNAATGISSRLDDTGRSLAVRSPSNRADITLQQAFTPGSGSLSPDTNLAATARDAADGISTRVSDAGRSLALRSPSNQADMGLQQAFTGGDDLSMPSRPSFDIDGVQSTLRRELTSLRFGAVERTNSVADDITSLRDLTVRVGDPDRTQSSDLGINIDEPDAIRSPMGDVLGIGDDTDSATTQAGNTVDSDDSDAIEAGGSGVGGSSEAALERPGIGTDDMRRSSESEFLDNNGLSAGLTAGLIGLDDTADTLSNSITGDIDDITDFAHTNIMDGSGSVGGSGEDFMDFLGESTFEDVGETTNSATETTTSIGVLDRTATGVGEAQKTATATEVVTETETETEGRGRGRGRGRPGFPGLPDFEGGQDDPFGGDDDGASKIFENPTISPDAAIDFDPFRNSDDSGGDPVASDLDDLF